MQMPERFRRSRGQDIEAEHTVEVPRDPVSRLIYILRAAHPSLLQHKDELQQTRDLHIDNGWREDHANPVVEGWVFQTNGWPDSIVRPVAANEDTFHYVLTTDGQVGIASQEQSAEPEHTEALTLWRRGRLERGGVRSVFGKDIPAAETAHRTLRGLLESAGVTLPPLPE